MKNTELAEEWLNRALSNLDRALPGKVNESIYYEDLCFDCQQSVEKALKSLLIFNNIQFPYTHTISKLLEIIKEKVVDIPDFVIESVILSDYAVLTRYPGDYEPVNESEFLYALEIAKLVYNWVKEQIKL